MSRQLSGLLIEACRLAWSPPETLGGTLVLAGLICLLIVAALSLSGLVDWSR